MKAEIYAVSKEISPHLRIASGAAGTDPETVRDVLGHDSVTTTDIYLHPYDRRKKEAACRLEGILKGDPA